jgi:2-(1,2-epoxy-1,2-dihydrophenyl)acetyl-CoA isomerase
MDVRSLSNERASPGKRMNFETLLVSVADGIARITLNRPKRKNAFSPRMAHELAAALRELESDRSVRVVVLRGAEGNFCSGGDLQGDGEPVGGGDGGSGDGDTDFLEAWYHPAVRALHAFPRPVIAVVEGVAAGAGVSLALGSDLVYAAEGARFSVVFVHRSLAPDCGGTWLLPRAVGMHKAKEIALFGEWFDAQDALRIGLVADVFAADELDEHVDERAGRLAALPPLALAETKRNLNAAFESDLDSALARESASQTALTRTDDFKEAMSAFLGKREPKFSGR